MAGLFVPHFQLFQNGRYVSDSVQELFSRSGLFHGSHPFHSWFVFPHRIVAARMLHENGHITTSGQVLSEVRRTLARAAQSVAEQHNWSGAVSSRQIEPQWQVTATRFVSGRQVTDAATRVGRQGERVVGRHPLATREEQKQTEIQPN
jgi:hypothetical protein